MIRIGLVSSASISISVELEFILCLPGSGALVAAWPPQVKSAAATVTKALTLCRRMRYARAGFFGIRADNGMLLVTGGAGFIGSNLVAALNDAGRSDVVVCDELGS